jgi:hypothetical protein
MIQQFPYLYPVGFVATMINMNIMLFYFVLFYFPFTGLVTGDETDLSVHHRLCILCDL